MLISTTPVIPIKFLSDVVSNEVLERCGFGDGAPRVTKGKYGLLFYIGERTDIDQYISVVQEFTRSKGVWWTMKMWEGEYEPPRIISNNQEHLGRFSRGKRVRGKDLESPMLTVVESAEKSYHKK